MTKTEDNLLDTNQVANNFLANPTPSFLSFLKSGGLVSPGSDVESSDNLAEILDNGHEFSLHRLLSDYNATDSNAEMDQIKLDLGRIFEFRSLSQFENDAFDQINPAGDSQCDQLENFSTITADCLSSTLNELCPSGIDSLNGEVFQFNDPLQVESEQMNTYTDLHSFEPTVNPTVINESEILHFTFDPVGITQYEHDYSCASTPFSSAPTSFNAVIDTPTPSPTTTVSKRVSARRTPIRTSTRLQSRAKLISFDEIINENCVSPTISESSSVSSRRTRRIHSVQRATDIQNDDDLSYYLERRRKNNEASKVSRAARKQKFDEMDSQCSTYERTNAELKEKINTLETVTAILKSGLINTFQRNSILGRRV